VYFSFCSIGISKAGRIGGLQSSKNEKKGFDSVSVVVGVDLRVLQT
jgi:hypothetical protein